MTVIRTILSWLWLGARLAWDLRMADRDDAPVPFVLTPKARRALDERNRRWN